MRAGLNFLFSITIGLLFNSEIVSNISALLVEFTAASFAFNSWISVKPSTYKATIGLLYLLFIGWLIYFGIAIFSDLSIGLWLKKGGWNAWHWTGQLIALIALAIRVDKATNAIYQADEQNLDS